MAKILQPTEENLRELRKFLRLGGLVGVPTETVYGLAANAFDADACRQIFEVKERPPTDPLICHVPSFEELDEICHPNASARLLAKRFWPGPLTFVLRKTDKVPDIVTAGLNSVAVRCSAHPDFHALLEGCGFPLAAPSANPFAYISPTTAEHVNASLGQKIRLILDGGPCALGVESTIIDLRNPEQPQTLRYGALAIEEIEDALGCELRRPSAHPALETEAQAAPGSSVKHYSPRTPLLMVGGISATDLDTLPANHAALLLAKPSVARGRNVYWLSRDGKLAEVAANLYAVLREIDAVGYESIIAESAPELALGLAINDRLRRASTR